MRLGVVCGLKSELEALGEIPGALTAVSGARPEAAELEALRLIGEGAEMLVSFGLAGGLDPILQPGAGLVPAEIIDEAGVRYGADPAALDRLGLTCTAGGEPILGSETIIDSALRKASLRERFGACAVDMESHRVARAAARAETPFLIIRAVADPADRALPPSALNAVAEDGSVRTMATIAGLARHPGDLPALLALKRDSDAGLDALRAGARRLAERFS